MLEVVSGNHAAYGVLVKRHTQHFFALAYRSVANQADAQDIVQDAFIKLWQKPRSYRREQAQFTTWFYRVIINACNDYWRKQSRATQAQQKLSDNMPPPIKSEQTTLEDKQTNAWQTQALEYGIANLPEAQRNALNLVVYAELPQKQVAQILGVSVKAVESLLVRAKKSLAEFVNHYPTRPKQPVPTIKRTEASA